MRITPEQHSRQSARQRLRLGGTLLPSKLLISDRPRKAYRLAPGLPAANVGRHHPDYGMTPQEHALAKRARMEHDEAERQKRRDRGEFVPGDRLSK